MGKEAIEGLITVATAIVGVAIIATLVSSNAQTSKVLQAGGSALGTALQAATAPVTGNVTASNTSSLLNNVGSWTGGAPTDTMLV